MFGDWFKRKRDDPGRAGPAPGDPGDSPVPWLSDEVWRAWNAGDASARDVQVAGKPISGALPTRVTDDDRRRAARRPPTAGAPLPVRGTLEQHGALLASTPGLGYFSTVRWPVCCERLSTLISDGGTLDLRALERVAGSLDHALTEAHLPPGAADEERFAREGGWTRTLAEMRAGEHGGDGIALFECRACGRVYGAYCHP
jgi:hypothetical protein